MNVEEKKSELDIRYSTTSTTNSIITNSNISVYIAEDNVYEDTSTHAAITLSASALTTNLKSGSVGNNNDEIKHSSDQRYKNIHEN